MNLKDKAFEALKDLYRVLNEGFSPASHSYFQAMKAANEALAAMGAYGTSDPVSLVQRLWGSSTQDSHADVIDRMRMAATVIERLSVAMVAGRLGSYQPMKTAPKDGTAILVLVEGSDIPRAVRWLRGKDDPHATEETQGPGWYMTWDGSKIAEHDGPRYWMHCPDDPDEVVESLAS